MTICICGKETGHDSDHKACIEEMSERENGLFSCEWCGKQLYEHQARAGMENHPECDKKEEYTNLPGKD